MRGCAFKWGAQVVIRGFWRVFPTGTGGDAGQLRGANKHHQCSTQRPGGHGQYRSMVVMPKAGTNPY